MVVSQTSHISRTPRTARFQATCSVAKKKKCVKQTRWAQKVCAFRPLNIRFLLCGSTEVITSFSDMMSLQKWSPMFARMYLAVSRSKSTTLFTKGSHRFIASASYLLGVKKPPSRRNPCLLKCNLGTRDRCSVRTDLGGHIRDTVNRGGCRHSIVTVSVAANNYPLTTCTYLRLSIHSTLIPTVKSMSALHKPFY